MQTIDALRNLYKKVTGSEKAPTEDQIAELIQLMADNWSGGGSTYELPAATTTALGGVKQAEAVSFTEEGATAETCAAAIAAIIAAMKASGAMA